MTFNDNLKKIQVAAWPELARFESYMIQIYMVGSGKIGHSQNLWSRIGPNRPISLQKAHGNTIEAPCTPQKAFPLRTHDCTPQSFPNNPPEFIS
jgi:hypothetical protein